MPKLEPRIYKPLPHELLDPFAVKTISRLTDFGHTAYLVGGCVRDLILGLSPKDFDVVTSARPNEVKRVFRNSRVIGRRFRLVHVYGPDRVIEVSTFRARPAAVPESDETEETQDLLISQDNVYGSPEDDALRRDFTINGLFYDIESEEILDYVEGLRDLSRRVLRSIGDPSVRFREDPVRMIRALKFAGKLGFVLEPEVRVALKQHRTELLRSSPARNLEELYKVMASGASQRVLQLMVKYRFLKLYLPKLAETVPDIRDEKALLWKTLQVLDEADEGRRIHSNAVMLAALLFPLVDPMGSMWSEGAPAPVHDLSHWAAQHIRSSPILKNASRQDVYLTGQILIAQQRFHQAAAGRPSRQAAFAQRPYFLEAYQLFRIGCRAMGLGESHLAPWAELARRQEADRAYHQDRQQAWGRGRGRSGREPRDWGRTERDEGDLVMAVDTFGPIKVRGAHPRRRRDHRMHRPQFFR